MAGETPDDDTPAKPDEFFAKSKWQRFQIYIAGPAMNVLAAFLIMIGVYLYGASEPSYARNPVEVGRVLDGSSAAKAGIKVGDRLTRIAGNETPTWADYEKAMMLAAGPRDRCRAGSRRRRPDPALHADLIESTTPPTSVSGRCAHARRHGLPGEPGKAG